LITDKQIKQVTDIIVEEIQPEKVLLFGSYATGVPNEHSDIDIIVVVNKKLDKKNRIDALVNLNLKTALPHLLFPKDIKMYSKHEYKELKMNRQSFLYSVLKNSKTLYER
jgi:uncharacterized protein